MVKDEPISSGAQPHVLDPICDSRRCSLSSANQGRGQLRTGTYLKAASNSSFPCACSLCRRNGDRRRPPARDSGVDSNRELNFTTSNSEQKTDSESESYLADLSRSATAQQVSNRIDKTQEPTKRLYHEGCDCDELSEEHLTCSFCCSSIRFPMTNECSLLSSASSLALGSDRLIKYQSESFFELSSRQSREEQSIERCGLQEVGGSASRIADYTRSSHQSINLARQRSSSVNGQNEISELDAVTERSLQQVTGGVQLVDDLNSASGGGKGNQNKKRGRYNSRQAPATVIGATIEPSGRIRQNLAARQRQHRANIKHQLALFGEPTLEGTTIETESPEMESHRDQHKQHMDWKDIARRYGKMPASHLGNNRKLWWRARQSCICQLLIGSFLSLFPMFSSFDNYRIPKDLITDMVAGFTVAVMQIPQGMAYGLLAGVDPIYGLYVSFVPVLVMSLMSRSRHVSYGTFAIISMILVNATQNIKVTLRDRHMTATNRIGLNPNVGELGEPNVVLIDNHQPIEHVKHDGLLKNLIDGQPFQAVPQSSQNFTDPGLDGLSLDSFVMPSNIEILASISAFVGLIQILMSLVRMGSLSLMLSDQLVSSFTTASAIHVITSQISGLLDMDLGPVPEGTFKVFRIWWLFLNRLTGDFNRMTALLSVISILFLLAVKEILEPRLKRRFTSLTCLPSELMLMAALIFCSWFWSFQTEYDIRIVGYIPIGLPEFKAPRPELAVYVFQDALTVALVSFVMNLSIAQVYAKRYSYKINPNHELLALGTANTVSSFFNCFPCASSLSRSAILSELDPRSQLCGLFSCSIVVAIICYFAPILHHLPRSTLSCIIVVALKGILSQVSDLFENWRLSKLDAFVWIFTFISVLAVGVTYGLLLGIIASLFMIFFR